MLENLENPELFFGICSPLGTNNNKVLKIIENALTNFKYSYVGIKVTDLMKAINLEDKTLTESPFDRRYETYIDYANGVRDLFGKEALATLGISAARSIRSDKFRDVEHASAMGYVFDQFKRPEEIDLLRRVYGRLFVLISVYSDSGKRIQQITKKIAQDNGRSRPNNEDKSRAHQLAARDEAEDDIAHGQRMRDAFALADVFINIDDADDAEKLLRRFLSGIFGSNSISPTRAEYGMYSAKSASLRSSDLSRQVGAATFSPDGEIISMGSNEVPKAGGGTYWTGDDGDARDHVLGHDENESIKRSLLADIVRRLIQAGHINRDTPEQELISTVLQEATTKGSAVRDSQIMDLLEFGRIIHAEMSAVCDAARLGKPLKGAHLYCTTFPCHICAKHIIASGIAKVTYIEPYPKSYTEQLHEDSMIVCTGDFPDNKVQFSPFLGISPYRYREIFERGKRKNDDGSFREWTEKEPKAIMRYSKRFYLENELAVTKIFSDRQKELAAKGIASVQAAKPVTEVSRKPSSAKQRTKPSRKQTAS